MDHHTCAVSFNIQQYSEMKVRAGVWTVVGVTS